MIMMHVPETSVFLTEELFTNQSLVITKINASNLNVIVLEDVSLLELIVTITMHVLLIDASMEFAATLLSISQHLMHVQELLVTQLLDWQYTRKRIVMTLMHVPQTLAILQLENASTF
jgi:hypothetical protein